MSRTSGRVLKILGVFGSVQVVGVLCSILRTKCIALWLGAAGIGVFGLYNLAVEMIGQLAQLNIRQSGVKAISSAPVADRPCVMSLVRRLSGLLGLSGALLTLLLSPLLGRWTFGDSGHTLSFVILSVVIFFNTVVAGEQAVLQASERFKRLAAATLWGNVAGTALSVVLYRALGMDSILPSIVVFSTVTALAYYVRAPRLRANSGGALKNIGDAKPILVLGTYMTIAGFISTLSSYLFLVWLRGYTDEDSVGLYQAGYTIIGQYVGLVFTALAVEFFPRISNAADSRLRTDVFVRHEIMMLMWALLACIVLFVNMAPVVVNILYSDSFGDVTGYITLAAVGTPLKAYSFVLAYVMLSRGDGRIYLVTESVSAVLYLLFNVVGYRQWGLGGAGCAYVLWYLAYSFSVTLVYVFRYRIAISLGTLLATVSVTMTVAAQALLCYKGLYLAATFVSVIVVPTALYMVYRLFLKRRTLKE